MGRGVRGDPGGAAWRSGTAPGPRLADLGPTDPGGERGFDPSGLELRRGDARALLPAIPSDSIDFVATDPPYNVQLRMTMAGGRLAEAHANRRTDYAMVSDLAGDLANLPDYAAYLDAMGGILAEVHRVLRPGRYAALIVRDAYQAGRYVFTAADLAGRASVRRPRPQGRHRVVPGRDAASALRLPAVVRAQHRAPAHRRAAQAGPRQAGVGRDQASPNWRRDSV